MQLSQKENRENFIVLLFYYLYAIHTKYTYKFFKKYDREAREPAKEGNTAWNKKLCYLINNYNTNIGNLTLQYAQFVWNIGNNS